MNKVWLVARREYLYNLRRPAYLFAVFGVPIFTFVMWFIIFAVMSSTDRNIEQVGVVGYVDSAGVLANPPVLPEDTPTDRYVLYDSEDAARQALEAGAIGAYFVLPADYLSNGQVSIYSRSGVPRILQENIQALLLANLSRQLTADIPYERIQNPVDLTIHVADSGRNLTQANLPVLIFMPMIFAFVFLMASGVTSSFLMNGVVEEKTNRIMEILVTSITPMQLLLGKVLGLGALGLTQIVIWGAAAVILITIGQAAPFLAGISVPVDLMLVFLVYFILSYFLLSSLMAGIGAIAGSEQESRQYSSFLSIMWAIPFFFITTFITDPNGTVPLILTLIPFTSPMTVLLRLGLGVVPAWQLILSLIILLLTTVFVVWASARVFRWALLLYGKRISLRELARVIRQSPRSETVAAPSTREAVS